MLGPLEAVVDGQPLPLGAKKQRAVLAMLVLEANRPVSADRLAEGLWGESPPASGSKMVQLYISQLRKILQGQEITISTRARGYELICSPETVDLVRAERLVAAASDGAAANGDARAALALWRGPPLADLADEPFAAAEIRRCEELWLQAKELAIDAELAAGRHEGVLREVVSLAQAHPLQEHVQAQLMLALYRSGRQAEALEVFRATRARLVEEIGSEPGPELRDLHEQILHQSPSLDPPARPRREDDTPERRPRRRPLAGVLIAAAALLLAGVAALLLTRGGGSERIDENSVALVDATSAEVRAAYKVGRAPSAVAAGAGSVWVANARDGTVTRIDRAEGQAVTIAVGPQPETLAFGAGSLWVGGEGRQVAQVDPASNRVVQRIDVGGHPTALAVGAGALWIAEPREGVVVRMELARPSVRRRVAAGAGPTALAVGEGAVWVAAEDSGRLVRLAPATGLATASINVGNGPSSVAVGEGAVWVANRVDGTVSRVDPEAGAVAGTLRVGVDAAGIALAGGSLWVADPARGQLVQVAPDSGRLRARRRVGSSPTALAAAGGSLWVVTGPAAAAHEGGRLVVESAFCVEICLDPAGGYGQAWESQTLVYDGLLGYRRVPGAAGERPVGALATAVPEPLDGGRTYVFTLRRGIRFSNGRPVRGADVRASLERAVILSHDALPGWFSSLRGADACGKRCDLSSAVITDDRARTVTIRLRQRDPTLPYRLASVVAAIVPAGTPATAPSPGAPGTGAYRFASIEPDGSSRLVRNPRFRTWSAADRPAGFVDEVVVRRRDDEAEQLGLDAVEQGTSDVTALDYGGARLSAAWRSGVSTRFPSRIAGAPLLGTDYMFLNVREPPFDDVRVRRALNLATDRARLVALAGGPDAAEPACEVFPPSLPGLTPYCPYTARPSPAGTWTRPDLAAARRLIAASGTAGMHVRVWGDSTKARYARYFARLLRELGYPASLKIIEEPGFDYFVPARDPRNHAQIGVFGWIADFPTPATFFDPTFSCAGDAAEASFNLSRFCRPSLDRQVAAALRAEGPAAERAWREATRRLTDLAPAVPLVSRRRSYFTSARVGNVQQSALFGVMLDRAWVR